MNLSDLLDVMNLQNKPPEKNSFSLSIIATLIILLWEKGKTVCMWSEEFISPVNALTG